MIKLNNSLHKIEEEYYSLSEIQKEFLLDAIISKVAVLDNRYKNDEITLNEYIDLVDITLAIKRNRLKVLKR